MATESDLRSSKPSKSSNQSSNKIQTNTNQLQSNTDLNIPSIDSIKRDRADRQLKFVKPSAEYVIMSEQIYNKSNEAWINTIALTPIFFRLSSVKLKDYIEKVWRPIGNYHIHVSPSYDFAVQFEEYSDFSRILESNTYSYYGRLLMIEAWSPGHDFLKKHNESVQIWVRFIDLPMEFWTLEAIQMLASYIANPVLVDENTAKKKFTKYARVLLSIDTSTDLKTEIPVLMHNGTKLTVNVEYEFVPSKCFQCKLFGHEDDYHEIAADSTWIPSENQTELNETGEENEGEQNADDKQEENESANIFSKPDDELDFLNAKLPDHLMPDVLNHVADAVAEKEKEVSKDKGKNIDVSAMVDKNMNYAKESKIAASSRNVTPPKRSTRSSSSIK